MHKNKAEIFKLIKETSEKLICFSCNENIPNIFSNKTTHAYSFEDVHKNLENFKIFPFLILEPDRIKLISQPHKSRIKRLFVPDRLKRRLRRQKLAKVENSDSKTTKEKQRRPETQEQHWPDLDSPPGELKSK